MPAGSWGIHFEGRCIFLYQGHRTAHGGNNARLSGLNRGAAMSDEGRPMQGVYLLKKFSWRGIVAIGESMEKSTTWSVAGTAAIAGLVISQLASVSIMIPVSRIRLSLLLLTASILIGAVSKQIGMAVTAGLKSTRELEELLTDEHHKKSMREMTITPRELAIDMAQPFLWPLSIAIRRGGIRGVTDYLAADKTFVMLFCIQLYLNALHMLLGLCALLTLVLSIKL
jgi:hypothetical protein